MFEIANITNEQSAKNQNMVYGRRSNDDYILICQTMDRWVGRATLDVHDTCIGVPHLLANSFDTNHSSTYQPIPASVQKFSIYLYILQFDFFPSIRSSELVHRLGYLAFTEKSRVRFPDSEEAFFFAFTRFGKNALFAPNVLFCFRRVGHLSILFFYHFTCILRCTCATGNVILATSNTAKTQSGIKHRPEILLHSARMITPY